MEGDNRILRALNPKQWEPYPCIWYPEITCPIKTKWKLSPENLVPWCMTCKSIGYLDEQIKLAASMNDMKKTSWII